MCMFGLLGVIISDNGNQLAIIAIIDFCHSLRVRIKFIPIVDPRENGQAESTNKVILKRIMNKLVDAKELWVK